MTRDEVFMNQCFELALKGKGKVAPNPMVGSIVVSNNQVIGQGYHMKYGGLHAEVNAINNVALEDRHLLDKSTLYVSLEPCFHFGKTPPCVDYILKHNIPRVVISCGDPNPRVNGQSIRKLRDMGVKVKAQVLEAKGEAVIADFLKQFSKTNITK